MCKTCVAVLLLLVGISLAGPLQGAIGQPDPVAAGCTDLYERARQDVDWGVERAWIQGQGPPADSLRIRAELLRQARSCYGDRRLDRVGYTFWYEAAVHAKLQQFPKAFGAFTAFFDRFHPVPDTLSGPVRQKIEDQVSEMYWARGYLHYRLGDLTSAVADYLRAFRTIPEANRERRATLLMDVGVIYQRLQDFDSAERHIRRAERILGRAESMDADLRQLRARSLFQLADMLLEREFAGDRDSTVLRATLTLARRSERVFSDRTSTLYGKQLVLLADASVAVGHVDSALAYNRRALRWARETGDFHTQMVALFKRGWMEQRRGRWSASEPHLRRSLAIARQRRDLNFQRRILEKIGLALEMQERWADAESAYRRAVEVVEAYRSSLRATQWSLTAFSRWQDVHRGLVRVLIAQDRPSEAFRALETTRARHLTDLRIQSRVSEEMAPRQRIRFDSLTQALTRLRAGAAADPDRADSLRTVESQLVAERRQLVVLDESTETATVDSLQTFLRRENRAVVSYFLDDAAGARDRPNRSHAFVLTADTLRAVPLPEATRQSVEARVESISPLFSSSGKETAINAVHFDLDPLHALYRTVYEPVADLLPAAVPLTILPDGPLYRLPFAMLVTEEPPHRFAYDDASYLLHRRATSLELSASLLPGIGDSGGTDRPEDLVGMGVSEFDRERTAPQTIRSILPRVGSDSSGLQLASLPGVEREIRSIRRIASSGRFALNEEATESVFHASKHTAKVLHLASHSFVHPTSPLYNTFLLAVGDSSSSDDGWLFLHEIQTEEPGQIPLVVLSGCSTAEGTLRSGEGMEGLQYAFRAMGARSTVSNLWPADDEAAVELTRAFYKFLQDGHPKDVALRQAQRRYLEKHPDRASPFFWAPTVLYGAPESISFQQASVLTRLVRTFSPRGWLLVGLMITALAGSFLVYRRRLRRT